jgi:hypothetical protein
MATKSTTRTAKQRNQLIFLAIGGVLVLGLAVLQGPKLWKQVNGSSSSPAPAPTTTTATGTGAAGTGAQVVAAPPLKGSAVIVKPSGRPGAKTTVAGVSVKPWQVPQANAGQLWTFSRLQVKDPFVQQVKPEDSITPVRPFSNPPTGSSSTGSASAGTSASARPATSTRTAPAVSAPTQLPPTFATIEVNGNEVRLKLDQRFPPSTKVFKLDSLKPRAAVIVLAAGGKLGPGGKVTLKMGDSITLVNSATGKRYTLRLLYTGSEPEVVQKFSTKAR